MKIFKNSVYSVEFMEPTKTIKFNWEEGHKNMTFEDFKEACWLCNLSRRLCSVGKIAFERIAGRPFLNGFAVPLQKNTII